MEIEDDDNSQDGNNLNDQSINSSNQQLIPQVSQQIISHSNNQMINCTINRTDDQLMELASKFGEWFYSMLPEMNSGNFDVNNFWPDSKMRLKFEYNSNCVDLTECGNQQIVNTLKQFVSSNLKLKPNLLPQYDGVRCRLESHGLLVIIISGVLYFDEQPVGLFDNMFGLVRDSNLQQDNWRIRSLEMLMKLARPIPTIEQLINKYKQIEN